MLVSPQPMATEVTIEGSKASLKSNGLVCGEELWNDEGVDGRGLRQRVED